MKVLLGVASTILALMSVLVVGENPLTVARILVVGSFGSLDAAGYTIYLATPLIMTGLSVSWALRAGLFNIGAEGQMAIGGLCAYLVGHFLKELNPLVASFVVVIACFVGAGAWGAIAGWFRAKRGTHEVLITILLNYVAYALLAFMVVEPFRDRSSASPQTLPLSESYRLPALNISDSSANWMFFFSILTAVLAWWIAKRTRFGLEQRLTGEAPEFARRLGVNLDNNQIASLFVAGGFAGMASLNFLLGDALYLKENFMSGAGFFGIAVALISRANPVLIIFSALFFGALTKGAIDLDIDTENVSKDFSFVIQALIILILSSQSGISHWLGSLRNRFVKRKV
ncbi:MAG: ABC transporter permease [Bdellovibrionales bacterium CG10_big_fil_rev_8_21_14_0_10_45_34]|nr:MAG: ABC transporter permease [Bdellovibrionales bacterium CG10_big_fil_rev_8_21_14_0_10_45_34]